jgi:hypothetical protein
MFYTIYKITNKIDRKIYIGKHQTKDLNDGYMGSGKLLKYAIEKHGLCNFEKDILFVFDNEEEMNAKEAKLVSEEFVNKDTNYNLCPGGKGGWGYINENNLGVSDNQKKAAAKLAPNISSLGGRASQKTLREKKIGIYSDEFKHDGFKGKTHSKESKIKIGKSNSINQSGDRNSQFGTLWITNGNENKKIKKEIDIIPEGWYKGRVSKNKR